MEYLYITIIILAAVAGLIISLLGFSGTLVLWAAMLLCAIIDGFQVLSVKFIVILLVIVLMAEGMDLFLSAAYAKKYGASKKGIIGAVIGGIAGVIIFSALLFGFGTVIGALVGTFVGGLVGEYLNSKDVDRASRAGIGALIGRVFSMGVKVFLIIIMTTLSLIKFF